MRSSLLPLLLLSALVTTGCSEEESPIDRSDPCAALAGKLQSCGFGAVLESSPYSCEAEEYAGSEGACILQCALQATCEDLGAYLCGDTPLALWMCGYDCTPKMTCNDGTQVPEEYRCDGDNDCPDGSDEASCPVFTCTDGQEIPSGWECDGWNDCLDGSDEHAACPAEPVFTCTSGEEILAGWECDGWEDCLDGSDEVGCPIFTCTSGEQIAADGECDEWTQCSDGSDEHAGCWYHTVCQ